MQDYCEWITVQDGPRLPLEGSLDLTYRCNNDCRHCWVSIPANSPERENELTFDQITRIVDEARTMGCHKWAISGGEPMLRPDFPKIFDHMTRKSASYSLNTNGTLINDQIAGPGGGLSRAVTISQHSKQEGDGKGGLHGYKS